MVLVHADRDLRVLLDGRFDQLANGRFGGTPFYAMEYVEGVSNLAHKIVDLTDARLAWKDKVDKAKGVPLTLNVAAVRNKERVRLDPVELKLADIEKLFGRR